MTMYTRDLGKNIYRWDAFNWIAFLQNGKVNASAKDDYIYMYSPEQLYYNEAFLPDDTNSRTYGMKLSPKWISDDGTRMVLIWSDAGYDHSRYYKWNQMEIDIVVE